ncbi:hypothetical protein HN51_064459 [Arachis hypogaea]|uniref:FLZ-type domain-containing protein n=1 Tax=Arachis hypogaea TaxID=3818 RepID=A0A444ZAX4_ARAHY|nr:uncharacterized protein LOC107638410 [Arachis ipaensis]XP_025645147.1 FCS-Like Zinc finger 14 [Arachis hypogaea]QHO05470.1 uncharacterized protein DS421_14g446590 [Arachis hypogaea]RYR11343.1 hypothetical protein Ahy_B04g068900 isoform C [Arachis hypogaea]
MLMLGKRPSPMIGKLSELLVSGGGRAAAVLLDTAATGSPRSPLDMKAQQSSPRGLKGYDLGGVGLKIVVALDNEELPKRTVCVPNLNRSKPIPVCSMRNPEDGENFDVGGSLEDYTYVTCHVPNKTFTKVYYDGGYSDVPRHGRCYNNNNKTPSSDFVEPSCEPVFPTSNFLSSCHLCRKKLDGKDIYMYRGEKGFCSPECRSRQMMMDERKELCRSEAVELSWEEQIFSTGILAL